MITIAIIEDEKDMQQIIVPYIEQGIADYTDVEYEVYQSAEEYLMSGGAYDMVITDIELPGINGLELGKRTLEKNPKTYLIFLTAYSEFATESYIMEAYQYVLKRDMEKRLPELVQKVVQLIEKNYEDYRWIGNHYDQNKIYYRDIIYIQKLKGTKYSQYVTTYGTHSERLSLAQIFDELHNNAFILVDRGHIININHIKRLRGNVIYMDNGEEISISRVQNAMAKEKIAEYWRTLR